MSEIKEWYYKGRSEMSFGAKINSPLPKIIAVIASIVIITACGACFILRDYLYDIVQNPQLVLYANQNENGFYLNIPYKYDFHPENYIDENLTIKYENFMDQNDLNYTYSINGNVNTTVIGDYTLLYKSSNRMSSQEIKLTVHVKDLTPPLIKLNAEVNADGDYNPIVLIRDAHNDGDILGSLDFNADDYIIEITDDLDKPENIRYEHTGNDIDLENGKGTKMFEVIYTAIDRSGNSSVVTLPLTVMDKYDAVAEAEKERIDSMERELNILLGNWERDETDAEAVEEIPIYADDFTWLLSDNTENFVLSAMENVHYNGSVSLYAVSGAFITEQVTAPGNYTVNWCTTDGQTCTQNIIVKDDSTSTTNIEETTEETSE